MGVLPKSERSKAGRPVRHAPGPGHLSAATTGRTAADGGSVFLGSRPTGEMRQLSAQGIPPVTRHLIAVQKLPASFDRRVWPGCQALTSAAMAWCASDGRVSTTPEIRAGGK